MFTRPLLIGRGPWAQKLYTVLPPGVNATLSGAVTAKECIREARTRGNDSVIIASRTDSHAELLKLSFEQKLPVFCEKPLCMSVAEADEIEAAWRAAGQPPFLCDFVHLWSIGFEHVWPRYRVRGGVIGLGAGEHTKTPKFNAQFGGPVRRADIHPVWDYGCHAIAMALMLGIDLRGLEMNPGYGDQWFIENANFELIIDVNADVGRRAEAHLDTLFDYAGGLWDLKGMTKVIDNAESPPLQRALNWWLTTNANAWKSAAPTRDGMWLPVQVTRVLESVCPSQSPFK